MKNPAVLFFILAVCMPVFAAEKPDVSEVKYTFKKDYRTKNAEYLYNVEKENEKERYERKKQDRHASGFMTVEEYELLSAPVDKTKIDSKIPGIEKSSDMKYVPQPVYKIVRYNNPPGSPELSLTKKFYENRQMIAQGVTSPDYTKMVYPAVYFYPENSGVACDLFVVPLEGDDLPLNKIMKANIMHRNPEPILSTDKSVNEKYIFRTLTPIDFSYDSQKLLAKEKIGSSQDGIWQTNAIVYDFETKTSYNLTELRAAIVYYWKTNKGVDLDDKRWDIYPLGFDLLSPERVVVAAYAYTGENPVFLGTWSVDSKGEQTRLISLTQKEVSVSMNGFKIIKDGAIAPDILKIEEEHEKQLSKLKKKQEKEKDKSELKQMTEEHKANMKKLKEQYNQEKREYKYQDKIEGSTSQNDAVEQYKQEKEIRDKLEQERQQARELKEEEKKLRQEQKQQEKENGRQQSEQHTEP